MMSRIQITLATRSSREATGSSQSGQPPPRFRRLKSVLAALLLGSVLIGLLIAALALGSLIAAVVVIGVVALTIKRVFSLRLRLPETPPDFKINKTGKSQKPLSAH